MLNDILQAKGIKIIKNIDKDHDVVEKISQKDIAIIGISGKFPMADNVEEFWDNLQKGKDCIQDFPNNRKEDIEQFGYLNSKNIKYFKGGFLNQIDKFDYNLFSLSSKEANLLDPNQRLFLQETWNAIGNAGYNPKELFGYRIGIYVGFSSDFGDEYKKFIQLRDPSQISISAPGNIKSIIASRISYLFNFTGPSMTVDTACSSSLVAVHLACKGIHNGDCEMAIAGGVKIHLFPAISDSGEGLGIESKDYKTRSFSEDSSGTGFGEGVASIVLKPLGKAIEDNDYIYAVIKGSAINQDGRSVGITAPNAKAHTDVILNAWKDADIYPELISYIEAHGTGTKLGDPIEIEGIQEAFKCYTEKRQFCAIGTVKSNIGHIDNAAGIAGLIKLILALKNKKIPPSINFYSPNKKIPFENTPLFFNDRCIEWEPVNGKRLGGISSFGLSGTNAHIILEEAPPIFHEKKESANRQILTLTAMTIEQLKELTLSIKEFINGNPMVDLGDICYTLNLGRQVFESRLAILFDDKIECLAKLEKILSGKFRTIEEENIYIGEHKIVPDFKDVLEENDIYEYDKKKLDDLVFKDIENKCSKIVLDNMCRLFIRGANINWKKFYVNECHYRIPLPVYVYQKKRCWLAESGIRKSYKPELKCLAESIDRKTYSSFINVDDFWILNEHIINGDYVMPGTAYIEMISEILKENYGFYEFELSNVVFLSPFSVKKGETIEIQIVINTDSNEFIIVSKSNNGIWTKHSEGNYKICEDNKKEFLDINDIISKCRKEEEKSGDRVKNIHIELGPRWNCINDIYMGDNEVLVSLKLPDDYTHETNEFILHPALFDCAVNLGLLNEDGVYLPFAYKKIRIKDQMGNHVYSYIRENKSNLKNETKTYDIYLSDKDGNIFCEISGYSIKKINNKNLFYDFRWIENDISSLQSDTGKEIRSDIYAAIFCDEAGIYNELEKILNLKNLKFIKVIFGNKFAKISENEYETGYHKEDYDEIVDEMVELGVNRIIHLSSIMSSNQVNNVLALNNLMDKGIYCLFNLVKSILNSELRRNIHIDLVLKNVFEITGKELYLDPYANMLLGFMQVANQEYAQIKYKCVDIGDNTNYNSLLYELFEEKNKDLVVYRDDKRFIKVLDKLDINKLPYNEIQIKNKGIYIISGGFGGIGKEIANFLSSQSKVNICFISRTPMPERKLWDNYLLDGEKEIQENIRFIKNIEKQGSNFICYEADIADSNKLDKIFKDLRELYGRINGIFHCAGISGDGFIINKDINILKSVLSPKVQGTWLLDKLTKYDDMDFLVLFSSITSFLGSAGQSDYTAANAFLDTFSQYRNKNNKNTLSINWTAWNDKGMAFNKKSNLENNFFMSIDSKNAMKAFERILNKKVNNIIIGELNINAFSEQKELWKGFFTDELSNNIFRNKIKNIDINIKKNINVIIKGKSSKDIKKNEKIIANIWANVLNLDEINIYDSFYDMGGDSLLAVQLLKEMEKEYAGLLDITDIFSNSSVYLMAQYIDKNTSENDLSSKDDIDDVLMKLANGEISINEADEKMSWSENK